ncbi:MAG TPA: hypothetical protein VFV29_03215 [Actinomycetota bacterium]|nr:hypothetical protein [Actinomycetota bacterium]
MVRHVDRIPLRAFVLVGALITALALPVAVSADTTPPSMPPATSRGAVITVDPVIHVQSKVLATVEATFTCEPFLLYDWETGQTTESTDGHIEFGQATIVQASGRTIVSGSGELSVSATVVCDGTTVQSVSYPIVASNAPWKNGAAIASATVYIVDANFQSSDYAASGPISVKLTAK